MVHFLLSTSTQSGSELMVCVLFRIVCFALSVHFSLSLRISPVMTMDRKRIDFFATTAFGLERTLANEVRSLSGVNNLLEGKGSVSFQGTVNTGLEALLWLRTPLKLMERISTHNNIKSKSSLYDWIGSHNWQSMIDPSQTLKCDTILGQDICAELNHSHFTALTIKNAIVDQLRSSNTAGMRPSVDTEDPDMPLSLYLHRARGTLYRVWSGEKSMHKRGYRSDVVHKAALRETTAAALLLSTEWASMCGSTSDGQSPPVFCDPMCGSGTFVIEAALLAADTAPGLIRYVSPVESSKGGRPSLRSDDSGVAPLRPNPLRWPDLADGAAPIWQALWNEATLRDRRGTLKASGVPAFVLGNDIHGGAVNLARQAAAKAGVQHLTHFSVADVAQYKPPAQPVRMFVTNPPWGHRLDGAEDAAAKLDDFSRRMSGKGGTSGIPMWVLSGGGERDSWDSRDRSQGRYQREEHTLAPYLPGRPAATMRLRVAATDMMFEEHLI